MLSKAKQVMPAVAWFRFTIPTSNPAISGPKLVMIRPVPLQNDTAVARTCVGNNSGKYTAWPEKTPNTKNPNANSNGGQGPQLWTHRDTGKPPTSPTQCYK